MDRMEMKMKEPSELAGREMPRYKCHKIVSALKIVSVWPLMVDGGTHADGRLWIHPEAPYHGFPVTAEWAAKHDPQPGGYFVVYDDDYTSFSPAEAFEAGYTLIEESGVPSTVEGAVDTLVDKWSAEDRATIQTLSPEVVHHTAGMAMRNAWGLWDGDSTIKRDAVERYSIAHADDISGLIFTWAFAKVRGDESFDPAEHVKQYHRHWGSPAEALAAGGCPPQTEGNQP